VDRAGLLRRGVLLEAATVGWNVLEGVIAVAAGMLANSVALIAFGVDSFVETTSGALLWWRLRTELTGGDDPGRIERIERKAARTAGGILLALALYILIDASRRLLGFGEEARESRAGIVITALSLGIMPFLGWVKLRTAQALGSRALRADAYETIACAWLALATLAGLVLNAALGWWWADPLAALGIVPLVIRKGLEGWRGDEDEST
jgi:divalent metal cation (Fe/Co/Zn/Cd) transporter